MAEGADRVGALMVDRLALASTCPSAYSYLDWTGWPPTVVGIEFGWCGEAQPGI